MLLSKWCVALSAAFVLSACDPSHSELAEESDDGAVEPGNGETHEERDADARETRDADARETRDADVREQGDSDVRAAPDASLDAGAMNDGALRVDPGDAQTIAPDVSQPQSDAAEAGVGASDSGPQPPQCASSCSGHGRCAVVGAAAVCSCDEGYGGSDCASCAAGLARYPGDGRCVRPTQVNEVRVSAPSASCVPGGRILLEGVDSDFDGTLEESEITKETTVCAVVRSGDVTITNAAELESLRGVTDIGGNLTIKAPFVPSLEPLRALVSVGKNLVVEGSNALVDLRGLGWLDQVGGLLTLRNNANLNSTEGMSALRLITGDLTVDSNPALSTLALGPLQVVQGGMSLANNAQLTRIDGSRLRSVVGGVQLLNDAKLEGLAAFAGLGAIGGALRIVNCDALVHLRDLGALRDIASLLLRGNAKLTDLGGLAGLKTVRGNLQLASLPALRSLFGDGQLSTVSGHLSFYDLPTLTRIDGLDQLVSVGAGLFVGDNAALEEIAPFARLSSLGASWPAARSSLCKEDRVEPSAWLEGFPYPPESGCAALLDLIRLEGNAALRRFGGGPALVLKGQTRAIAFSNSAQLSQLDNLAFEAFTSSISLTNLPALREWPAALAALPSFAGLGIYGTGLLRVSLPKYTGGDGNTISIGGNAALTALELPAASTIGYLDIRENAALQSISSAKVGRIGSIYVNKNPALRELLLPELGSAGALYVVENAQLQTLEQPHLGTVENLTVQANPALTRLHWPKLEQLVSFTLDDNDALLDPPSWDLKSSPTIKLQGNAKLRRPPTLSVAPSKLELLDNDGLISLEGLRFQGNTELRIEGNDALTSLAGASATKVSSLRVVANAALTNLDSSGQLLSVDDLELRDNPQLNSIAGTSIPLEEVLIVNNDALPSMSGVTIPQSLVYTLRIEGNANLTTIAALSPITQVGTRVYIANNPRLPQCAAQAYVSKLLGQGDRLATGNDTAATCP